ncbi:MAG: NAD(P)/FAD-dependent oxidoreductase [Planctomycetota bacterium]|jgi:L-2-hydroxyglutarate oxidase LhgO
MEADITIIGAGVIGLAVASELADDSASIFTLERHDKFGQETSSRNSEVIHAGIYYPKDSLKAKLCIEGRELLYEICAKNGIGHKRTGKLIVATNDEEAKQLEDILERGNANGVDDLCMLSEKDAKILEPHVCSVAAIHSPSTGIIDSHELMRYFMAKANDGGAEILYGSEVVGIEKVPDGYEIRTKVFDNDKKKSIEYKFKTGILINCAGLDSDTIAEMAGIDIKEAGYNLHYCKGQYFSVGGGKNKLINRLIYPVPKQNTVSLGIHATLNLQGRMRLGPDAAYIDRIQDYSVDQGRKKEFFESARKFLPFLTLEDLEPDTSGIRPKLAGPGENVRDFVIKHEADRGFPGLVNLIGIESPGLTASPALAKHVKKIVRSM